MNVRFKIKHCASPNHRIAYPLISEDKLIEFDEVKKGYCECYHVKFLGFVSADRMEVAELKDIPAIEVIIKLSL